MWSGLTQFFTQPQNSFIFNSATLIVFLIHCLTVFCHSNTPLKLTILLNNLVIIKLCVPCVPLQIINKYMREKSSQFAVNIKLLMETPILFFFFFQIIKLILFFVHRICGGYLCLWCLFILFCNWPFWDH